MALRKTLFDACLISYEELRIDARTLNFARTLIANGKKVCVLSSFMPGDYLQFEKEGIVYYRISKLKTGRAWLRVIYFIFGTLKYTFSIKSKSYWAEDFYCLPVAFLFKLFHRGKFIYDSREIFSALGPLYENPIKQAFISSVEKLFVSSVNDIIVTGQKDMDYLKKYFLIDANYHLILNLPQFNEPVVSNILRQKFNIPAINPIIIYQGMILPGRGLEPAVKALEYFPEAYLLIVGGGSFKNEIQKLSNNLNLTDRVLFFGEVDYDELHSITCSADVGLCYIEPISFSYSLALPNKLFEYCMAAIPTLCSDLPAMKEIIGDSNIGKVIPLDSSPEVIAGALKELCRPEEKLKYRRSCLEAAKGYSYQSQTEAILKILN